jgi:hypothetical protein
VGVAVKHRHQQMKSIFRMDSVSKLMHQLFKFFLVFLRVSRQILCKATKDSFKSIQNEVKSVGKTPSVDKLVSLMSVLNGSMFAKVFMLLALSSFLCPNSRNVSSARYYSAVVQTKSIKDLDWCSLVLLWLNHYIKKYQNVTLNRTKVLRGGCAFLLVVRKDTVVHLLFWQFFSFVHLFTSNNMQGCYLEFLYTSEFNFGRVIPRIKFWSTSVVQTLSLLDATPGSSSKFGRHQVQLFLMFQ